MTTFTNQQVASRMRTALSDGVRPEYARAWARGEMRGFLMAEHYFPPRQSIMIKMRNDARKLRPVRSSRPARRDPR